MVRLGGFEATLPRMPVSFQFQYGAIGRNCDTKDLQVVYVSIPVWCDWEQDYTGNLQDSLGLFQFQYGAIGRTKAKH